MTRPGSAIATARCRPAAGRRRRGRFAEGAGTVAALLAALATLAGACERPSNGKLPEGPAPAPEPRPHQANPIEASHLPPGVDAIRLGFAPTMGDEAVEEQYRPIASYLEEALGVDVAFHVADSYQDLIDRMAAEELEVALLPPLSYVEAHDRNPRIRPLASMMQRGRTSYSSLIYVRADDPAESLGDLKGRRMAFVDRNSTSGYLFPYAALLEHGIEPRRDLAEMSFTRSHLKGLRMLDRGEVDAAAAATGMVELSQRYVDEEAEHASDLDLRILYKAGNIPYDALCAGPHLNEELTERIRHAFLAMNKRNRRARTALEKIPRVTGWAPARDARYDVVRRTRTRVRDEESSGTAHDGT